MTNFNPFIDIETFTFQIENDIKSKQISIFEKVLLKREHYERS